MAREFPTNGARAPFSFVYNGQPSRTLLTSWPRTVERREVDANRRQLTLCWTDPETGLQCRCVETSYSDFPVSEWVVFFRNTGARDTPLLEQVRGVDAEFCGSGAGDVFLHGLKGDSCTADSYEPYCIPLAANEPRAFAPAASGKSCDGPQGWPYFNVQVPGGGVVLVVGWPGQWRASFARTGSNAVAAVAGQAQTRMRLKPGEELRTPLVAALFWKGDRVVDAQNVWRRWYLAHVLPRTGGVPQPPTFEIQAGGGEADEAAVQRVLDAGLHPDICWRDAAWYVNSGTPYTGADAWMNTGTWEIDPAKYPKGFRPFSDWVRARDMQFLLWFEPERVGDPASWLAARHPEWMLPGTSHGALLDLGNPAALAWLIGHIDGMVKAQGLDWYREDMNGCGPLPAWQKNDAPDRQGVTENLYVQGHLAFWDELRRRNPKLRIDSCASGGRRNDLETMRRAVPLLRSDFQWPKMERVVEGNQGHTYGLSFWLPFQGTATYLDDVYAYRSFYVAGFGMGALTPANAAMQKKAYDEFRRIAPRFFGDYYPLTPYSLAPDQWLAWQFNRPEQGDGVVQAFRRAQCADGTRTFVLQGLDAAARYEVSDIDSPDRQVLSGEALMRDGVRVGLKASPGAAVILYERVSAR